MRQNYSPSTITMLTLEDLERMSLSAMSSGEASQAWTCWRLSNSSMARGLGGPVSQYGLNFAATRHELAAVSLNRSCYLLKKLSVEIRVRYLNIGYYICRHS